MTEPRRAKPVVVTAEGGERWWALGTLATVKASGADTGGRLSVWENAFPQGAAPPVHTHPQDESFYVVEGEMTVWLNGDRSTCGPGSFFFAPGGTPHTFRVDSQTAVVLALSTPSGIENFLLDVAVAADRPTLPPSDARRPSDAQRIAAEQANGVEILGPPPGPDD